MDTLRTCDELGQSLQALDIVLLDLIKHLK